MATQEQLDREKAQTAALQEQTASLPWRKEQGGVAGQASQPKTIIQMLSEMASRLERIERKLGA